jgi:hypothetical protein
MREKNHPRGWPRWLTAFFISVASLARAHDPGLGPWAGTLVTMVHFFLAPEDLIENSALKAGNDKVKRSGSSVRVRLTVTAILPGPQPLAPSARTWVASLGRHIMEAGDCPV